MKRLDEFAAEARKAGVHLTVNAEHLDRVARLGTDGLFHIPLLALCMLIVAREKKGAFATADLAAWVGATLGQHFSGIHAARRKLEWSLPHRRRCADALVFLENVQLVVVQEAPYRCVRCTAAGLEFIRKVLQSSDEIGVFCRGLIRSYRRVEHHGLELL